MKKRGFFGLRLFLTLVVALSFANSIDFSNFWYQAWDCVVSILLIVLIWITEIDLNDQDEENK